MFAVGNQLFGVSTDTKPASPPADWTFLELDTGKFFTVVGGVWTLLAAGGAAWGGITGTLSAQTDLQSALDAKQATLVSGTNIKTVNGSTLLGSGNLAVSASDPSYAPGSFTVATGTGRLFLDELILNGTEEAELQGTAVGALI